MDQTIGIRWTRDIIALAVAEGADEGELWAAAGIELESAGDQIPEDAHLRVWEAIMRALRSPGFPVRVAEGRSIDEYALLGLACKTSETLREALTHLIRFTGLWRSQYECELVDDDDAAMLVVDGPTGDLGRRCTNESALAQILKRFATWLAIPCNRFASLSGTTLLPRSTNTPAFSGAA